MIALRIVEQARDCLVRLECNMGVGERLPQQGDVARVEGNEGEPTLVGHRECPRAGITQGPSQALPHPFHFDVDDDLRDPLVAQIRRENLTQCR